LYWYITTSVVGRKLAFSALTLLVWHQEEHPACKMAWSGLSEARCKLFAFAYDPDATATPIISCLIKIQSGLTFLVPATRKRNR